MDSNRLCTADLGSNDHGYHGRRRRKDLPGAASPRSFRIQPNIDRRGTGSALRPYARARAAVRLSRLSCTALSQSRIVATASWIACPMTKLHMTSLARIDEQIDQEQLKSLRRRYLSGRPMRYVFRPFLMSVMLAALMIGLLAVIVEVSGDSRWFRATFLLFFHRSGIDLYHQLVKPPAAAAVRSLYLSGC